MQKKAIGQNRYLCVILSGAFFCGMVRRREGAGAEVVMEESEKITAEAPVKKKKKEDMTFEELLADRRKPARMSGIIAHPTSFPSMYGIGDLGQGAFDFIDFLARSGQHLWQVLPMGPTGFGDSPYQSLSAFAGQSFVISPDRLRDEGLLMNEDFPYHDAWDSKRVDYGEAIPYKTDLLHKAYRHFCDRHDAQMEKDFDAFVSREKNWLCDYALFMALKDCFDGKCWLDWDEEIRDRKAPAMAAYTEKLSEDIRFHEFVQFVFFRQWTAVRRYAAMKDIYIIGDIPIFMSIDCADVWANRSLFRLDSKGYPTEIAGVPPDYFSATGQLWGNPLYDWKAHEKTGYDWWVRRIERQLELFDYVRIDHFRGMEACWAVPAGDTTAENGKWEKGPGRKLFMKLTKVLGNDLPIIAEDLGIITPEVEKIRDEFGLPGMKVLQFGFGDMNDHLNMPHFYTTPNCVCYTGTHDNETTVGWYSHQPYEVQDRLRMYGNCDGSCVSLDFIRFAMSSIAKFAIFPIQDVLQLGNEARMNTPGAPSGNWSFRYEPQQLEQWRSDWLMRYTKVYARY